MQVLLDTEGIDAYDQVGFFCATPWRVWIHTVAKLLFLMEF